MLAVLLAGCSRGETAPAANSLSAITASTKDSDGTAFEINYYPNNIARNKLVSDNSDVRVKARLRKIVVHPSKPSIASQDDILIFEVLEANGQFKAKSEIHIKFDEFTLPPKMFKEGEDVVIGFTGAAPNIILSALTRI